MEMAGCRSSLSILSICLLTFGFVMLPGGPPADAGLVLVQVEVAHQTLLLSF